MRKTLLTVLMIMMCLMPIHILADDTSGAGTVKNEYDDTATIRQVQEALNDNGYDCGSADGIAGSKTLSAIARYKKDKRFTDVSSAVTDELLVSLHIKANPQDELLYHIAEALDPGIDLQIGDTNLNMERVYDGEGEDHIEEFFRASCQMLRAVVEDGRFSSMTASFQAKDCFEPVLFVGIEGRNEFVTEYYGPMSSDAKVKIAFPDFYKKVFGAYDKTARSESDLKEPSDKTLSNDIPDDFQKGWYWVYYSFDGDCTICSIDDDRIELQILADNTIEEGWNKCQQLTEAMDMFNYLCDADPLSMPYTALTVAYIDRKKAASLYTYAMEKKQDGWKTTESPVQNNLFANGVTYFGKGMTLEEALQAFALSTQSQPNNNIEGVGTAANGTVANGTVANETAANGTVANDTEANGTVANDTVANGAAAKDNANKNQ